jgi:rubredoxin
MPVVPIQITQYEVKCNTCPRVFDPPFPLYTREAATGTARTKNWDITADVCICPTCLKLREIQPKGASVP